MCCSRAVSNQKSRNCSGIPLSDSLSVSFIIFSSGWWIDHGRRSISKACTWWYMTWPVLPFGGKEEGTHYHRILRIPLINKWLIKTLWIHGKFFREIWPFRTELITLLHRERSTRSQLRSHDSISAPPCCLFMEKNKKK